jgi:hypothetical protein
MYNVRGIEHHNGKICSFSNIQKLCPFTYEYRSVELIKSMSIGSSWHCTFKIIIVYFSAVLNFSKLCPLTL